MAPKQKGKEHSLLKITSFISVVPKYKNMFMYRRREVSSVFLVLFGEFSAPPLSPPVVVVLPESLAWYLTAWMSKVHRWEGEAREPPESPPPSKPSNAQQPTPLHVDHQVSGIHTKKKKKQRKKVQFEDPATLLNKILCVRMAEAHLQTQSHSLCGSKTKKKQKQKQNSHSYPCGL